MDGLDLLADLNAQDDDAFGWSTLADAIAGDGSAGRGVARWQLPGAGGRAGRRFSVTYAISWLLCGRVSAAESVARVGIAGLEPL